RTHAAEFQSAQVPADRHSSRGVPVAVAGGVATIVRNGICRPTVCILERGQFIHLPALILARNSAPYPGKATFDADAAIVPDYPRTIARHVKRRSASNNAGIKRS